MTNKDEMRSEYISRINHVIDYIENNLSEELNLIKLADVAGFSPFHFHRLFKALVGETLNSFINRVKIEKAASMILNNSYSLTGIAMNCGFSSSAAFSRSFREYFKCKPSDFKEIYSKNSKSKSNNSKEYLKETNYINEELLIKKGKIKMKVSVKEIPQMEVAYCRHIGPYSEIGSAFGKLMAWAGPRNLLQFPKTKVLGVYNDDPHITEESKLRSCACITVPSNTKVDGEIGKMIIPEGKYAVAHFEIKKEEFSESWDSIVRDWLPESGYQMDERPCFEMYLNDAEKDPKKIFKVDMYLPIKPL